MNRERSKIDPVQLIKEIRELTYRKKLYLLLKTELTKRGWWREKPRGNTK
jgi:hypothetical protein